MCDKIESKIHMRAEMKKKRTEKTENTEKKANENWFFLMLFIFTFRVFTDL